MDQGGNVVNACEALGVEIVKCNCHRVNSAVLWSLGISGTATRCKNKAMGELMKKLAACVGVVSHSAVNNDMLKEVTPEAGGGPPPYIRAHQAKRHEVICILNFVCVLCLLILNSLVLVCVSAVMHEICIHFILRFCFSVADY